MSPTSPSRPIRVALDAMGGDHAPGVTAEGAVLAVQESHGSLEVVLVGREAEVREALSSRNADGLAIEILDAPEVIGMGESPSASLKGKPHSSIHVGLGAHKAGKVDAFASAGNTGAVMAASTFILGRLPGVLRPALPGYFPTVSGMCICVDVGANVDVRADLLVQFATMGRVFAQHSLRKENPSVALVNVGEEPGKGTEVVKETFERLSEMDDLGFIGNIEGRDVFHHGADVIVCDGFVGNVMLKLGESFSTILPHLFGTEIEKQGLSADVASGVKSILRGVAARFDYENYGGVPLLGVGGTAVIGHGGSSARAIARMVTHTAELVAGGVTEHVAQAIARPSADTVSA
ncbi:phosphate acyltransferase PlsX [Rubricoccus marinus]|uniref:Phosphate acyltransferase n=1 Tax=Rubricoccus marinus TaxID=716817 RepID=A0A259U2Z9_9BACT|nr:phosphate acyltransferase PlsX [Rubricoccus marinus]OZC04208.1 phosphate acyltransferase PlsX [Rubricoccus marinus]